MHDYWTGATSTQSNVDVQFGEPIQAGSRTAVEFWATMKNEGEEITLMGCMLLRFADDGRCEEVREYWNIEPGSHRPPPIWGR